LGANKNDMKINTKLLLAFLLIALIPLATISTLSYFNAKETVTRQVLSHLESVAAIQRTRVESIVEQNLERLSLVSSRTQLRLSLDNFVGNPNPDDQDKINKILLDARSSVSSFQDISVLTLDGKVVASTDAARIGSIHSEDEVFIRGQRGNTADTFFLNGNQKLSVYLSGPLYLEGKLLGVVVIESAADNIVSSIQDYTGLGTTGETIMAAKNEDGDAVFLTPTRFDEHAALSRMVSKEELDSPTIQALSKNEKLFTDTVDYRGEPVLAATRYIEKTGWGLVTKIDKTEALAPVTSLQHFLFTIILLSLALVMVVALYLARAITRPINRLTQVATRISEGDLAVRAEVTSRDEIGLLARACNQMKDSLVNINAKLERELVERKQTEEKYSTLVEGGNDGIIIIQDGLVKFANSKMVEMTGFSLDEATGKPFLEFVSPEYRSTVMQSYQKRTSGEEAPNNYEIEILAKNGGRVPVEINASQIEFEGRPADMAIVRDITERKKTERALIEGEEKYHALFENAHDGIVLYDAETGAVVDCNQEFERETGRNLAQLSNRTMWELRPPELVEPARRLFNEIKQHGQVGPIESAYERPNGEVVPVEYSSKLITVRGRRYIQSMARDITERKRAEDALRESEERYRDLFDNANDLIQSVTSDGRFLYVNKAWQKVLGYNEEEIANLKVWDIIHPDSMNHCMETFQKVMSGENVSDIEAVFVAKDGSLVAVEGNAHAKSMNGKPISTQGIFRDVTARKRAEERIIHLNSLLRALRDVNQLITRESDRERLIQQSCDVLVRTRGYEKAWILLVGEDKSPLSFAAAGSGDDLPSFMEQMRAGKYPSCVKQLWNQENPLLIYNNPGVQHKNCILADRHSNRGVYRCRLEYEGKVYGMLGVTIPSHVLSDEEEKDLFLELCGDISFALAAIERREQHERLEEELRQSEASLAEAQHIAHTGSWELDLISNKLIWSDEVYRMFGLRPQQFGATYEAFLDNIHPDDREMVNKAYIESVETKTPYNIVHRLLLKDGTVKYVRERCETFYNEEGKPIRSMGTVQDITERKLAEDELRKSEASLAEAQRIAHVGSWDWDILKNEISYSDEFHRMFGRHVRNLEAFLDSLHPDDKEFVEKSVNEALYNNRPYDLEYRVILPNGAERIIYAQGEVTFNNTGKPIRMIGTVQDITERKKMEEQLILTDRLASVGELASGIAHELNNPLTGVIGLSQLVIERDIPEDVKKDLKLVYSEAQRAANVVKNLLTFARKHSPTKELISVNDVINKVLELRAYEEKVSNIQVVTHLASDLPKIMADYFQIQQVFLNIIINAEHFMLEAHGKGTLTITTQKVGGVVKASFADDGPGIPKENLGHIFDPFFTTKEVGKGTGLGLSICHGIVSAHGGQIYAKNKLGKGATFIVELPIRQEEQ
jgi:PAS domain S-box-containing protein